MDTKIKLISNDICDYILTSSNYNHNSKVKKCCIKLYFMYNDHKIHIFTEYFMIRNPLVYIKQHKTSKYTLQLINKLNEYSIHTDIILKMLL